jgi:hypothetical protein
MTEHITARVDKIAARKWGAAVDTNHVEGPVLSTHTTRRDAMTAAIAAARLARAEQHDEHAAFAAAETARMHDEIDPDPHTIAVTVADANDALAFHVPGCAHLSRLRNPRDGERSLRTLLELHEEARSLNAPSPIAPCLRKIVTAR